MVIYYPKLSETELKQIKSCITANEIWLKLESFYQLKVAARKATASNRQEKRLSAYNQNFSVSWLDDFWTKKFLLEFKTFS